ncbi:hypothetical protein ABEG18_17930 [Alsobacter sp. KACC 23698]|uniref:Uncharacterized protein n=1 Tax=Alsobacter sp. KACC 23698 TaxID=3149229 RepID=A0AAU7JB57_9HYPH
MPHLDSRAIDIDAEGLDRLRSVIATAAGGALAYDPDAFALDGDHRAVAAPQPVMRTARAPAPRRGLRLSYDAAVLWA